VEDGTQGTELYRYGEVTLPINPTFTSGAPAAGTYRTGYLHTFAATSATPVTYSVEGSLPPGLTLNETTGVLSGSPTTIGVSTFTIRATNGAGSATQGVTLTINKAPLTVTASSASRVYGAANPALTVSYSGFVNGETAAVLDTVPTVSTAATAASPAGSYGVTASGGADNNYALTYVNGTLTVNKAPLTVSVANATREVGQPNPDFVISYAGFVNGETPTVLDTIPTATTTADAASPAGSYAITVGGGADNNYALIYVNGTLTVTDEQELVVTPQDPTVTTRLAGAKPLIVGTAAADTVQQITLLAPGGTPVVFQVTANSAGAWTLDTASATAISGSLSPAGFNFGSIIGVQVVSRTAGGALVGSTTTQIAIGYAVVLPMVER
jgi:hypothetical protein